MLHVDIPTRADFSALAALRDGTGRTLFLKLIL
jgi:hypothetical protein